MNDVILSEKAFDLLQMYAFPHLRYEPNMSNDEASAAFAELKAKGMVREGRGRAIVPFYSQDDLVLTGEETEEEFVAALKPRVEEVPGWVVTEKAILALADTVDPKNRQKALAVMRFFVADKDPSVH